MKEENRFAILEAYGFFENCIHTEDQFVAKSPLNQVWWKVKYTQNGLCQVWSKKDCSTDWEFQGRVYGVSSVYGIVTDEEDKWLKTMAKRAQKKM